MEELTSTTDDQAANSKALFRETGSNSGSNSGSAGRLVECSKDNFRSMSVGLPFSSSSSLELAIDPSFGLKLIARVISKSKFSGAYRIPLVKIIILGVL